MAVKKVIKIETAPKILGYLTLAEFFYSSVSQRTNIAEFMNKYPFFWNKFYRAVPMDPSKFPRAYSNYRQLWNTWYDEELGAIKERNDESEK